jgi:TRAP-type C4-dicarboxylate transport system permease small subunit
MIASEQAQARRAPALSAALNRLAIGLAYCGGAVVALIGMMSAVSIIGRSVMGRPIVGDFELVEIGTAIAGSLFLAYCQATYGHIAVDFFTLKASERTRAALDRFGSLLMAVMYFAVGWRTFVGVFDIMRSGETSMLMSVPTWIGYAGMLPGVFAAGLIALAQAGGVIVAERAADE